MKTGNIHIQTIEGGKQYTTTDPLLEIGSLDSTNVYEEYVYSGSSSSGDGEGWILPDPALCSGRLIRTKNITTSQDIKLRSHNGGGLLWFGGKRHPQGVRHMPPGESFLWHSNGTYWNCIGGTTINSSP